MQNGKLKIDAAPAEIILTTAGLKKLEDELENLKTIQRQVVAERIKTAIAFGDISENAEYDEAKNEQAFIEGKIISIENTLQRAIIVDEEDLSTEYISVGNRVRILDIDENEELTYTIVGSAEADPISGMISNESPVGRALLSKTLGETVAVTTPGGTINLRILAIER